jgi:hypothetical protein
MVSLPLLCSALLALLSASHVLGASSSKEPKSVAVGLHAKWLARTLFCRLLSRLTSPAQSTPLALEAAEFLADQDQLDTAFWAFADAWSGAGAARPISLPAVAAN